jgi:hypothetical protein
MSDSGEYGHVTSSEVKRRVVRNSIEQKSASSMSFKFIHRRSTTVK